MVVVGLTCLSCGTREIPGESEYVCRSCGGIREVEFDYEKVRGRLTPSCLATGSHSDIRRYLALLPVPDNAALPPLNVGPSPIYESPRLAAHLGIKRLYIKDDGRLPTGSFKDRAYFVGVARAVASKASIVAAASTGNAATSLAGMAASVGLSTCIFVPATAPEAKIAQLLVFGAQVFVVDADYDVTYDLCQQAVAAFGWYNGSAAVNPYLIEGMKTCGHEIAEQLSADVPDWVAMSVGDGCSLAGTFKGMKEMQTLGIIDNVPRFLAVQAEGAAPLTAAYLRGSEAVERIMARSVAESISVGMPRNPLKVLRAVRASLGSFVNIDDESMITWISRLARHTGVFGEPAATATLAGIVAARSQGIITSRDSVLAVISGHGLKDVKNAMRAVKMPKRIPPELAMIEEVQGSETGGAAR